MQLLTVGSGRHYLDPNSKRMAQNFQNQLPRQLCLILYTYIYNIYIYIYLFVYLCCIRILPKRHGKTTQELHAFGLQIGPCGLIGILLLVADAEGQDAEDGRQHVDRKAEGDADHCRTLPEGP